MAPFQSPKIDQVIKEAVAQNPNLQSAQARVQQNQDNLRAGYGAFFPQASGGFSYSREKFNPAQFGSTAQSNIFNLYTSSVSVSYLLDVFGGTRRTVEALAAQADYQNYTTQAAYLTLLGNVVNAAIAQAGYQASIEATERLIAFQKEQLRITETQFQAGTAPYANVVSVQSQLAATEATLPPIRQNLNKAQHLLAALVGRTPAEWQPPRVDLAEITLPGELPVTLPSELVRQRPGYPGLRSPNAHCQRQYRRGHRGHVPQLHPECRLWSNEYRYLHAHGHRRQFLECGRRPGPTPLARRDLMVSEEGRHRCLSGIPDRLSPGGGKRLPASSR